MNTQTKHTAGPLNNAAHTPGPWRYTFGEFGPSLFCIERHSGRGDWIEDIAYLSLQPNEGSLAGNARLIAAAPELLEALIEVLRDAKAMSATGLDTWPSVIAARAAIAKAQGGAA